MVSPVRNFAQEAEQDDMKALADTLEQATSIHISGEDLDTHLTQTARRWLVEGLRLLAKQD